MDMNWRDYIYYEDEWTTLLCGDVREILPLLPSSIAQTCPTSPPYWGLREYGTARWEGGDAECDHQHAWASDRSNVGPASLRAQEAKSILRSAGKCGKCGAVRVDNQIGLEKTPAEFVQTMAAIFNDIFRILLPGSTLWLNLGDSQIGGKGQSGSQGAEKRAERNKNQRTMNKGYQTLGGQKQTKPTDDRQMMKLMNLKPKDMAGIPWRTAFALQDAGWWLRSELIWYKRNCMPESVRDRPTKAHEQIFLLANAAKYFYDNEAIKEECAEPSGGRQRAALKGDTRYVGADFRDYHEGRTGRHQGYQPETRNARSVWDIPPKGFDEAHFATFPLELPERCIKAGTSEKGQCSICKRPFERILKPSERYAKHLGKGFHDHESDLERGMQSMRGENRQNKMRDETGQHSAEYVTVGWKTTKGRDRTAGNRNGEGQSTLDSEPRRLETVGWSECCPGGSIEPQTVLEPFAGAGTTLIAAKLLGRKAIGIELNPEYCEMIVRRLKNETIVPADERGKIHVRTKDVDLPLFCD